MEDARYFRQRAAQCCRLAASLLVSNDPTKERLLALALEFEAKAVAAAAEEASGGGLPGVRLPVDDLLAAE